MAKAIKFNLILDENPVRNQDDILDNFNIEDILTSYKNGSLKRWLETREMADKIAELDKISGDDNIKAAMELCRIFHGKCSKQQIEMAVYPFEFKQKETEKRKQYQDLKKQKDEIIREYHDDYEKLLKDLENKGNNYPFVKAGVAELFRSYSGLYQLDAESFYGRFIKDHPLVILAMLANSDMRPILARQPEDIFKDLDIAALTAPIFNESGIDTFLEKWRNDNNQPEVKIINSQSGFSALQKLQIPILVLSADDPDFDGPTIYDNSMELKSAYYKSLSCVYLSDICQSQPGHVETFAGETDGYWKDVKPKGKQFLIIKMELGNIVRNAGMAGEEIKPEDVNGKFLILDGIDYKSTNAADQLVYMEI
jgi:hypothetical protein